MADINYDAKIKKYTTFFNFKNNTMSINILPEKAEFGTTYVTYISIEFDPNTTEDKIKYYQYEAVRVAGNPFTGILEITCNESKFLPIIDLLKNSKKPYAKVNFYTPHYKTDERGHDTLRLHEVRHCYLAGDWEEPNKGDNVSISNS